MNGMRWYKGKRLVSNARGSDYAHAGEEEAIFLALSPFPRNKNRQVLDVGCGQGGTANFIQKEEWGRVTAFDVEEHSISYAKKTYPLVEFLTSDVLVIDKKIQNKKFDLLCLFNSFYAFSNQLLALKKLYQVASQFADLVIFDYTDLMTDGINPVVIRDDPIKSFQPINVKIATDLLWQGGWQLIEIKDLTSDYKRWYRNLINLIENKREAIQSDFGEEFFLKALSRYRNLLDNMNKGLIGGALFYAKRL